MTSEISKEDQYNSYTNEFRSVYSNHVKSAKEVERILAHLIDYNVEQNPGWSITKILRVIHTQNQDIIPHYRNLFHYLNEKHRGMIQKKEVMAITRQLYETSQEQSSRNRQEYDANEASAQAIRKIHNIESEEKPLVVEGHSQCIQKYSRLLEAKQVLESQVETMRRQFDEAKEEMRELQRPRVIRLDLRHRKLIAAMDENVNCSILVDNDYLAQVFDHLPTREEIAKVLGEE
jgi:uncharacterized protein with von Willebrand factor type A (vWA) domain